MTANLDCHWCAKLQEPHEAHALAKSYFDLVIALDREKQEHHEAELNLKGWKAWAVEDMQRHARERTAWQRRLLRDLSKKGTAHA